MSDTSIWQAGQSTGLTLAGPAGALEAWLETPTEFAQPEGVALICHPHPQFGGSMTNKVVHSLARSALGAGLAALRFNFRGVGASEGEYADGVGETEDALAALAWLQTERPQAQWVLAGFSFGAAVALRVSAQQTSAQLVTIAPPLKYFEHSDIPRPLSPWLLVHGDADDVVDCAETQASLTAAGLTPEHHVLSDAGHFFHGRLHDLRDIVEPCLKQRWLKLGAGLV